MNKDKILGGVAHNLPSDIKKVLHSNPDLLTNWNSLTPLARNEFICWVISVKKKETREEHIMRLSEDILNGKRRPCCWSGCIHRKDKPLSSTQKWLLEKKSKK